jgi:hypothetical protein
MKVAAWVGMLGALACIDCLAGMVRHQKSPGASPAKLERMPEALEVEFALSALPPHLREHATVYVLDPSTGYVVNRQGTNGVSCIVVRTDWQFPSQPFRDDIFWPVCYDKEGSKTLLQDYLWAAD